MLLFITPAYAQATGTDPLSSLLVPLALMLPIFYFLVLRPNQTRDKQRREVLANIRRGDTVVMTNGFIGRVTKVKDNPQYRFISDNAQGATRKFGVKSDVALFNAYYDEYGLLCTAARKSDIGAAA